MYLICPVRGQAKVSSPVKREAEASDKTIATAEASKVERAAPSKSPLKGELQQSLISFHSIIS